MQAFFGKGSISRAVVHKEQSMSKYGSMGALLKMLHQRHRMCFWCPVTPGADTTNVTLTFLAMKFIEH